MSEDIVRLQGELDALTTLVKHMTVERAFKEPDPIGWLIEEQERAVTGFSTYAPPPTVAVDPFGRARRGAFEEFTERFFADLIAASRSIVGRR